MKSNTLRLVCLIIALAANSLIGDSIDFEVHSKAVFTKAANLLTEGLECIVEYDSIPTTDGVFGGYIDMLCALPCQKGHAAQILQLINKSDPFLQEAGVELAISSINKCRNYSVFEPALCRLLSQPDLDPWVMRAIVRFAKESNNRISPDMVSLYSALAEVAYSKPKARRRNLQNSNYIHRSMWIDPHHDARNCLDQVMLNANDSTPRSNSILPHLENAYGTKGWKETHEAVHNKVTKQKKPNQGIQVDAAAHRD